MDTTPTARKPYPTDVSDDEWAFVAPYLTLMRENAPQREHPLREVFNGLRWIVRAGAPWRMLPTNLPRQAEFVICDQSIERTLAWLSKCRGILIKPGLRRSECRCSDRQARSDVPALDLYIRYYAQS